MDADDHKLDIVLKERQQWVVPVYQRQYTWGNDLIEQFWEDIEEISDRYIQTGKISPHFFGAIIYSPADTDGFGSIKLQNVVDGQQRLTTFHLFLAALFDIAQTQENEKYAARIKEYLFNAHSDAMTDQKRDIHKLWSSSADRDHYLTLVSTGIEGLRKKYSHGFRVNGSVYRGDPHGPVPKMVRAYALLHESISHYFDYWMNPDENDEVEALEEDKVFDALLNAFLRALVIVVIELGKGDDARAIFASLNGKSKPLSAFDLIRNDIFHRAVAQDESDEDLYYGAWQELESAYWQESVKQGRLKRARTDHFMAHMLAARTAEDVSAAEVAEEYKEFAESSNFDSVADEISDIIQYATVYKRLDDSSAEMPEVRISKFLRIWDMSVFHPVILSIGTSDLSDEEKKQVYKRIEDYVVRRDIAGLTRKNLNKAVTSIIRHFNRNGFGEQSLGEWFKASDGQGTLMPTFGDIQKGAYNLDAYHNLRSQKLRYILHAIEMEMRTGRQEKLTFDTDNLHVEHIMPEKWSDHWPLPSGLQTLDEDWSVHALALQKLSHKKSEKLELSQEDIAAFTKRQAAKHTLGNLTLLTRELNPSVGNSGWDIKRGSDGIGDSLLLINRDVIHSKVWNENEIIGRAQTIAEAIERIWPE